ncbi:MAG TPA: hypothetical protein VGS78_06895 [Candidatus Sulfotelmatobacter sp.]|nr:hypothetical protein [Candidatus Sulfotelmatobacter sp.]
MLAAIERNLNDLVQALNLLGVKRCGHCKKFFRTSNPGALFAAAGEVVCFECIPAWWPLRREQLTCEQRQDTEANLVFWLRNFHSARTLHGSAKLKPNVDVKFELLAKCLECRGTGTYLGDKRCRYCSGPGTVRVIVPDNLR